MNKPPAPPLRARLQTLLKIPEGQRTDAEWDELNELEITLALSEPDRQPRQQTSPGQHNNSGAAPNHGGRNRQPNNNNNNNAAPKHHKRRRNRGA